MILSVHALFGSAVASLVPTHPVAGFALGFVSHFVLDAIPHRDYDLISIEPRENNKFKIIEDVYKKFRLMRDISLVSFDALMGLVLAYLFFFNPVHPTVFLFGAVGSLLPDFFSFLYLLLKHKAVNLFFHFHASIIHSKKILNLGQITGVLFQFLVIAILIVILYSAKYLLIPILV